VVAAADGREVNLSDSDRYGTTLTVLIGDYYEVYYSQIDNVKYGIGDEIKEGDVIGTVAEPTRSFVLEGPHLFFKMTCKGEAVNPTEYLE
jgi:murein DD-endopeptidase MepM/ murein hydrolase activator NlpD